MLQSMVTQCRRSIWGGAEALSTALQGAQTTLQSFLHKWVSLRNPKKGRYLEEFIPFLALTTVESVRYKASLLQSCGQRFVVQHQGSGFS